MSATFTVMVIGGGIGGLCLAQGLKKSGVRVFVYERDAAPTTRLQGFRIHIDPQGSRALHASLPEPLWKIFDSTGGDFSQAFTMLNEQLSPIMEISHAAHLDDSVAQHRSVSRTSLRSILLAGLEESVFFKKRFVHYEQQQNGRVRAYFEDGSTAEADVLVAADGVNSPVRKQYLPGNDPVDTGVVVLGGKVPLSDGVMALLPPALLNGPAMITPAQPMSLFMAAWRRSSSANAVIREIENGPELENDYVILGMGARPAYFGLPDDVKEADEATIRNILRQKVTDWHPNVRKLVELLNTDLNVIRIRTSRPVPAWKTTNVTLLGDAIHAMTPYRGIGANIALRDAELLCRKLISVARGKRSLMTALEEYEAEMRVYGFAAVANSKKALDQSVGKKNFGFKIAMSAMRAVNAVPALRRLALARA
jgi:2-polyprenyl-6-methoxyphenol hydroxylase-like FAD-dependent oxidoreductase